MGGKQIRLFLVDGTPGGLTTLEVGQWVGHLVSGPRSQFADLLKRAEVTKPGVYLLVGSDESAPDGTVCYIGESDDVSGRLRNHVRDKERDFWDRFVVITSKDEQLTKGHVKYLESRLVELAGRAQRCLLRNGNEPRLSSLPEADRSDMEYFLDQLQTALPVLGINILRGRVESVDTLSPPKETASPVFEMHVPKRGLTARAQQIDGEFTLLAGSRVAPRIRASSTFAESTASAYRALEARRAALVDSGSIVVDDGAHVLSRDVVFHSPSTAGAIVAGRSCNGRTTWKTVDGLTFAAWETSGLNEPSTGAFENRGT